MKAAHAVNYFPGFLGKKIKDCPPCYLFLFTSLCCELESRQYQCSRKNWVCLKFPWTRDSLLIVSYKLVQNSRNWTRAAMLKYGQTKIVDMTAHDRRTTLLAIRLGYHVIYTVLRTGTRWRVHPSVESMQSAWKTRLSMSFSKISR